MSKIVRSHHECTKCNSSDAATTYSDGWSFLFSCNTSYQADGSEQSSAGAYGPSTPSNLPQGERRALLSRHISQDTVDKYGYTLVDHAGEVQQCAYYRKNWKDCSRPPQIS